jgi:hypothetical protein
MSVRELLEFEVSAVKQGEGITEKTQRFPTGRPTENSIFTHFSGCLSSRPSKVKTKFLVITRLRFENRALYCRKTFGYVSFLAKHGGV